MAEQLRIVFATTFGMKAKGTVRARVMPLARALARRGHSVYVIIPPWDSPTDSGLRFEDRGVQVENLSLGPGIPALGALGLTLRMARRILAARPQIVQFFKPIGYSGAAFLLLRWLRILHLIGPVRLVVDTDDWEGRGGWSDRQERGLAHRWIARFQERRVLREADFVTVASRALESLCWSLGVSPGAVGYLPNGIEEPCPAAGDGSGSEPYLLLYTRFTEASLGRLLDLLAAVREELPTASVVIVGQGFRGEEHDLVEGAHNLGLAGNLTLAGYLEGEDLARHLSADCVALYPMDDNLINRARSPAKLVELMAWGRPVVAEAVGEATTYIESEASGILVPPGDIRGMTSAARRLLEESALRRSVGAAARARALSSFSWDLLACGVEAWYQQTLAGTR